MSGWLVLDSPEFLRGEYEPSSTELSSVTGLVDGGGVDGGLLCLYL